MLDTALNVKLSRYVSHSIFVYIVFIDNIFSTLTKQGAVLSIALFAVFINDLVREVKQLVKGISCGHVLVTISLYADDIIHKQH